MREFALIFFCLRIAAITSYKYAGKNHSTKRGFKISYLILPDLTQFYIK